MNLLYIWNEPYSGPKGNEGYQVSSRYEITFDIDEAGARLSIRRRKSLSDTGFWGEHIYDVMAVVGRNGAGKTRLAYSIMDTLDEASRLSEANPGSQQSRFPFLLVFEDGERDPEFKVVAADIPKLEIDSGPQYRLHYTQYRNDIPLYEQHTQRCGLERFKFAYFTDALSLTDYKLKKYGVVYDGSLGGGIRRSFEFNQEMHYINGAMSPIINYFDDEMDRILKFVCAEWDSGGIPFPRPKKVTFSLKDYMVNLDYISKELDGMEIPEGKTILKDKCDEMQQRYNGNAKSMLATHIMLNVFKTYCIPQTSSEHRKETAQAVLEEIDQMECFGPDPFTPILKLMEKIEPLVENWKFLEYCWDALSWMQEQPVFLYENRSKAWDLNLETDATTVQLLYEHYRKTKFPFPYFSISFGLSTGEYAFLRRFVRINELLSESSDGHAYVINNLGRETRCNGLMIYFDEADQSMHPEWQRKQIDWLLQFISARFKTCKVQLVVSTHSPIMLSDIPRGHVLYLSNDGEAIQAKERDIRTFGSNIHTLFRNAFFLSDGTMGTFAERKINEIAQSLQEPGEPAAPDIQNIVEEIGDDVILNKLRQMCRTTPLSKPREINRQAMEQAIRLLRGQAERLEAAIRELEHMRYD